MKVKIPIEISIEVRHADLNEDKMHKVTKRVDRRNLEVNIPNDLMDIYKTLRKSGGASNITIATFLRHTLTDSDLLGGEDE